MLTPRACARWFIHRLWSGWKCCGRPVVAVDPCRCALALTVTGKQVLTPRSVHTRRARIRSSARLFAKLTELRRVQTKIATGKDSPHLPGNRSIPSRRPLARDTTQLHARELRLPDRRQSASSAIVIHMAWCERAGPSCIRRGYLSRSIYPQRQTRIRGRLVISGDRFPRGSRLSNPQAGWGLQSKSAPRKVPSTGNCW